MDRFTRQPKDFQWQPHPHFGQMSDRTANQSKTAASLRSCVAGVLVVRQIQSSSGLRARLLHHIHQDLPGLTLMTYLPEEGDAGATHASAVFKRT